MRDEPAEISGVLVAGFLEEGWGIRAAEVVYAPVGFGSYHWIGSDGEGPRWFVTVDRCDTEQVRTRSRRPRVRRRLWPIVGTSSS